MVFNNINQEIITRAELKMINRYFDFDLQKTNYDDELGSLVKYDCLNMFEFKFENGNYISITLQSTENCYYGVVVLFNKEHKKIYEFDNIYEFENIMIFENETDKYICELFIKE